MMKRNFGGLGRQFNDSVKTKEAFASNGGSTATNKVFNFKKIGDMPTLKLEKDKTYTLRFVPYEVNENHPLVMSGRLEPGDMAYVFDYMQHRVGADGIRVLCPRGTYGHSCPICEKQFELRQNNADKKEIDALKSSRRVLYNVVLAEEPSKVYLLNESHFLFEKELLTELQKGDDDGEAYDITDLCVGASDGNGLALKVTATETDKSGMKFNTYSMRIVKNKFDVDTSVLDKALPLQDIVTELSKTELTNILYGEDEEEDVEEDVEEEEDPIPVASKDEDEEDVDCDGCPHGFEFGVDTNRESECDDCKCYEACYAEKKRRRNK